jgi:hypothetical protein
MRISDFKILVNKAKREINLKISSALDFIAFKLGIDPFKKNYSLEGLTVYYIGENFPPRIPRMVKWLKRTTAINCVLICAESGFNQKYSNDSFEAVFLFRNQWHLKRILKKLPRPSLIHGFGPKSFYPDTAREHLSDVKFIYDMQDVLAIYYGLDIDIKWYQKEFVHEKNCLALSSGLVSHALEPIPAYKLYGINHKNNRLFFPLYCDDDSFTEKRGKFDPQNISVVYAGEVQGSGRDKNQFGNVQFFDLIEILAKQRIHFHIYPSPTSTQAFIDEYKALSKSNPYLHMHEPVVQSELAKELSKYDFGFIPFFKSNTGHLDYKHIYSTSLKLFNFIEAGLPILISKDITFQNWIASRYKAAISIEKNDIYNLRQIIESLNYEKVLADLLINRPKLSLSKNIYRLVEFYHKIIQSE